MTRLPFDPDLAAGADVGSNEDPFESRASGIRRSTRLRRNHGPVLAVAAGGAVGGSARHGVDRLMVTAEDGFPWGTFTVNITGAFALSLLLILVLEIWPPTRYVRPFLAVGVLGSFTTFSTLMVEVDELFAAGHHGTSAIYLTASIAAGLAVTSAGLIIGRGVVARVRRPAPTEEEVAG